MADYDSSLPVRTQQNGDVVSKICDGTTNTQLLNVDANGKLSAKLFDGGGTAVTSQANGLQRALDVGINVLGVQIDPRQIRALTNSDVVKVEQNTSPWITKDQADGPVAPGTVAAFSQLCGGQYNALGVTLTDTQQAALQLTSDGKLLVSAAISSIGSNLNEDHNWGAVGANTLRVAAELGNAAGMADFNFGAASAQTLRTASLIGNASGLADFNYGAVGAQTIRAASQIGNATGAAAFGAGATDAQTLRVEANQGGTWDVRVQDGVGNDITSVTSSGDTSLDVALHDAAGNAFSASNPLPVTFSDDLLGAEINDYKTATIAASGTDNHVYTVSALKTLLLKQVWASGSGKLKAEVQVETGVGTGVYNTFFVGFNSTANPNIQFEFKSPLSVAAGVRVRVIMTGRDNQGQDVYSTISGNEI